MSVLENLPSLIDRPRRSLPSPPPRPGEADIIIVGRADRPSSIVRPESANNNPLKRTGDGAAGDLTIVRPAAAAPPRRPEQVEQVGRHRAAQPLARA